MKIYRTVIYFTDRTLDEIWLTLESAVSYYEGLTQNNGFISGVLLEMIANDDCPCFYEGEIIKENGEWWT